MLLCSSGPLWNCVRAVSFYAVWLIWCIECLFSPVVTSRNFLCCCLYPFFFFHFGTLKQINKGKKINCNPEEVTSVSCRREGVLRLVYSLTGSSNPSFTWSYFQVWLRSLGFLLCFLRFHPSLGLANGSIVDDWCSVHSVYSWLWWNFFVDSV